MYGDTRDSSEQCRASDAVCVPRRCSTCAATARKRGNDASRDDDDTNEVISTVSDVDLA